MTRHNYTFGWCGCRARATNEEYLRLTHHNGQSYHLCPKHNNVITQKLEALAPRGKEVT